MRATATAIATKPLSSDRKLDRAILRATQPLTQTPLNPQPNPTPKTPTIMGRPITPIVPSLTQKHGLSRRHIIPNPINPPLRQRITRLLRTTMLSPVTVPSITNPLNPNLRHTPKNPPHHHRPLSPRLSRLHNNPPSHHPISAPSLNHPNLSRNLRSHRPCQTHRLPRLVSI